MEGGSGAVEIEALSAGYAGTAVLHGITARFPAASVTAVVGPNGSGKSTLLSVLAGVLKPYGGSVRLPRGARPALVVQRSAASDRLPITVRETVAMGRWARRGPWRRLSEEDRSVVDGCLCRMEIEHLAHRPLGSLSGGQRQRTLIAQGLAQRSPVLLLDEPATGLDACACAVISRVLTETAASGTTVIQVTHDHTEAANVDHCLHLSDGRVVSEGRHTPTRAG